MRAGAQGLGEGEGIEHLLRTDFEFSKMRSPGEAGGGDCTTVTFTV